MTLANIGSNGNSAILLPNLVNSPLSFNAPSAYNYSNARNNNSCGGGSIKSKLTKSLIPKLFNINTTFPKLVLCISGIVFSSNSC